MALLTLAHIIYLTRTRVDKGALRTFPLCIPPVPVHRGTCVNHSLLLQLARFMFLPAWSVSPSPLSLDRLNLTDANLMLYMAQIAIIVPLYIILLWSRSILSYRYSSTIHCARDLCGKPSLNKPIWLANRKEGS